MPSCGCVSLEASAYHCTAVPFARQLWQAVPPHPCTAHLQMGLTTCYSDGSSSMSFNLSQFVPCPCCLQERWAFMRINKDLVAERAGLVQTLRDYALGKLPDHDAALAASRDLRTNVMTEVCILPSRQAYASRRWHSAGCCAAMVHGPMSSALL